MSDRILLLRTPRDDLDLVHGFLEKSWPELGAVAEETRLAFETALVELAGNVMQHADDGTGISCRLTLREERGELVASITDSAEPGGFVLSARRMPDPLAESGRGLALIQLLVDELDYREVDGRNLWTIRKRIVPS